MSTPRASWHWEFAARLRGFVRGPQNPTDVKALVDAVAPKPLNLLVVGTSA